ncbi:4Fe-4S dicluster domain-containing protein [Magnetospirillum aberrantis]|uniref:Sulfite reductase subunit A n=1 Tax=Magnetospirillum aberrantis SpK TaxID=908842 RepID=A0A7C9QUE1_9PROT|nr:4Fe-4S dicluster domain-containing protein [Magnetospirillum aberrantis]NFV80577.1 sulfite reductase subunit A [Magnetospirillum aberrantis SpK]
MPGVDASNGAPAILDKDGLGQLIAALRTKGYRVVGPRSADGAIVYDDIDDIEDLPAGLGDETEGGRYRLRKRTDDVLFGYTLGAQGWKRFLYPPRQRLFAARRQGAGFQVEAEEGEEAPMAFLGPRACELAAVALQARVFGDKTFPDPGYQARLAAAFVVAVECGAAASTCFCASMGTGPEVTSGHDIRLLEIKGQRFLAEAGSDRGREILTGLSLSAPTAADLKMVAAARKAARAGQGRVLDRDTAAALQSMPDHPRWDDVAARCLSCGNCTMVCPTCFCTTVEDVTDLSGDHAERWRKWDSCFSVEFSYIHGGAVRTEAKSRYRQWITHKLSTWADQFGSSGCVGCGRCITWCPVGIDITAEVAAIAATRKGTQG